MTPTLTLTRADRTLVLPITLSPRALCDRVVAYPEFDLSAACAFAGDLAIDNIEYCFIEANDTWGAYDGVTWRFDGVTPGVELA